MSKVIQLFSNSLGTEEINAIKKVYKSKWLGYGQLSKKFEESFAKSIKSKHALGISCATAGLFMSMEILDIGPGDEVILPSITFIGCLNAIVKSGAKPVFADVDLRTLNILPSEIERLKTKKTKAILLLHYGGQVCDFSDIEKALGRDRKRIAIIEDSANSIHSTFKNKFAGTLGDIGIFSFDAMKVLVTGDGGMMTIQNNNLWEAAKKWRYLGSREGRASGFSASSEVKDWWTVDAEVPGNRYLINDVTSAVGLVQLGKLPKFINSRKKIWNKYKKELSNLNSIVLPPEPKKNTTSSYYLFWLQLPNEDLRNKLAWYLRDKGIYSSFRYYPLHKISYLKNNFRLKNSENVSEITLNIPLHQNLSNSDLNRIISEIRKWHKKI